MMAYLEGPEVAGTLPDPCAPGGLTFSPRTGDFGTADKWNERIAPCAVVSQPLARCQPWASARVRAAAAAKFEILEQSPIEEMSY